MDKEKQRNIRTKLFYIIVVIYFVITIFFPETGEGWREHVYMYGYPATFLTIYDREFFYQNSSGPIINFHLDILQLAANILTAWLNAWIIVFLISKLPALRTMLKDFLTKPLFGD